MSLLVIDVAVGKYGQVVDKLNEITSNTNSLVPDCNEVNAGHLNIENDDQVINTTSFWIQFKCLFKRSLLCTLRDLVNHKKSIMMVLNELLISPVNSFKSLTRARLVINISCALLVGSLFFSKGNEGSMARNNVSLLFFLNIIVMFSAKMATVLTCKQHNTAYYYIVIYINLTYYYQVPLERPIIAREHLNNWYTLKTYFLAKSAADFPFEVIWLL